MSAPPQTATAGLPPIVLLVEDDADTRDLYETALGMSGFWVAKAAEPDDALEYAKDLRPDSILMDIGLPTPAEGFFLARAFRQEPRLAQTSIVGVTGFEPETIQDGADLFTALFYKPVPLDLVVRRLRWLSAKSAVLRARAERAKARVPQLVSKSEELKNRAARLQDALLQSASATAEHPRYCPKCRKLLQFTERRTLSGTSFDYFSPCTTGCGIYCYDRSRHKLVALVE